MSKLLQNILPTVITLLILGYGANTMAAGDVAAGKAKSVTCSACHGADGIGLSDLWPNLAGQKEGYLVNQIKAYRDGVRVDPLMAPMVSPLTDQDIENLAAYYSSLK